MDKPMIAHIVAASTNGVIGKDGDLPWNIPGDMGWFRSRTRGRALIMGRKTFEALGHPLPNRLNVVVTRQKGYTAKQNGKTDAPVIVCSSIEDAIAICRRHIADYNNEIFIIGGGEIYKQSVKDVDTIYLTRVHAHYDGDAKYPDPNPDEFELTEQVDRGGEPAFSIMTYTRRN